MTVTAKHLTGSPTGIVSAAQDTGTDILERLGVTADAGLSSPEVARRLVRWGPNAVSSHRARLLPVLWHQLRSPLLALLLAAAVASYFVGERSDAVIIGVIVGLSVGLGFVNEYRAEKAAEALHSQIHHQAVVIRDGRSDHRSTSLPWCPATWSSCGSATSCPPTSGCSTCTGLECDESVLTGESLPAEKDTVGRCLPGTPLAELSGCALMGTVVHAGSGRGVVVATGARTEFGKIAAGLATHPLDTEFQVGLRKFSMLLVYVAGALTTSIFVINVVLHKPVIDALLFSLAIAVGITPQLLPAVVSTSLAAGSRRMSRRKVLVKRLVCIEDLGDVDVLFTDKTGTLTQGRIDYMRAVPAAGEQRRMPCCGGACSAPRTSTHDGQAVRRKPTRSGALAVPGRRRRAARAGRIRTARGAAVRPRAAHGLCRSSATQRASSIMVTKGAPEIVLDRCVDVPAAAREALAAEFAAGNRVVAVATRPAARREPTHHRRRARAAARRPAGVPRPAQTGRRRFAAAPG